MKDELYHCSAHARPVVLGKYDHVDGQDIGGEWSHQTPADQWLLRAKADLSPAMVARVIAGRLKKLGVPQDVAARMDARLIQIEIAERTVAEGAKGSADRLPWFCPGCPHNTSTVVPDGSIATAGIGCHGMAIWMDRRHTMVPQMGGEGVPGWASAVHQAAAHLRQPGRRHLLPLGLLAIRAAINAGVNITYKILFNGAVAMTGGQPVDGRPEVPDDRAELRGGREACVVI